MNEETKPTEEAGYAERIIQQLHAFPMFYKNGAAWIRSDQREPLCVEAAALIVCLQREKEMAVKNEQNCWERRDEAGQRMIAAERELAALRRGEFICTKCGLRKDGENEPAEF